MPPLSVNVSLYGAIARFGHGRYVAQVEATLEPGARLPDLLARLGIPETERGYVFINAILSEVPGLSTEGTLLCDGDHVGIFAVDRLWPYQYRDGIVMSPSLNKLLAARGAMRHAYRPQEPPSPETHQPAPADAQEI